MNATFSNIRTSGREGTSRIVVPSEPFGILLPAGLHLLIGADPTAQRAETWARVDVRTTAEARIGIRSLGVWLSYLVIATGVGLLGVGAAMLTGWEGPLPSSDDWSIPNEWLGMGCPLIFSGLILLLITASSRSERRTLARIAARGVDGTARVIRWSQRGGSSNYKPRFEMTLEITVAGQPPYTVTKRFAIHAHLVEKFEPDTTWQVRIDPDDPQELLMEGIDDEFRSS